MPPPMREANMQQPTEGMQMQQQQSSLYPPLHPPFAGAQAAAAPPPPSSPLPTSASQQTDSNAVQSRSLSIQGAPVGPDDSSAQRQEVEPDLPASANEPQSEGGVPSMNKSVRRPSRDAASRPYPGSQVRELSDIDLLCR